VLGWAKSWLFVALPFAAAVGLSIAFDTSDPEPPIGSTATSAATHALATTGTLVTDGTSTVALSALLGDVADAIGGRADGTERPEALQWSLPSAGCDDAKRTIQAALPPGNEYAVNATLALADGAPDDAHVNVTVSDGDDEVRLVRLGTANRLANISASGLTGQLTIVLESLSSLGGSCADRPVDVLLFDGVVEP
jgi:hypothetical protein